MIYNSKKYLGKKIAILVLFLSILAIAGYIYFSFFGNKNENQLFLEQNEDILKDKEAAEVEIDKKLDSDRGKLPDYLEKILGTSESNPDTDGDGYDDLAEIKNGYNPLSDKKYTEEEWQVVKGKIKEADEELYTKELEILIAKKCKYSSGIAYSEDKVYKALNGSEMQKDLLPLGATFGILLAYEDSIFPISITFLNFETENAANKIFSTISNNKESKECNINGVKGSCRIIISQNTENKEKMAAQMEFSWLESKTLKQIGVLEDGAVGENGDAVENKAKEKIGLFVLAFKDCIVEPIK